MLKSKKRVSLAVPLNLQHFAGDEPEGGSGAGGEGGTGQGDNPPAGTGQSGQEVDFEKRLQDELAKINARHQEELDAARSEAEKLAKMTADEKAKFEFEQREKKLADKEKEIAARELKAETLKTLSEKKLPADIIDIVLADNAENTAKNIDAFKSVFDKAVQAAVEERLVGKSPQVGSGASSGKGTEEQVREQFSNALKGVR